MQAGHYQVNWIFNMNEKSIENFIKERQIVDAGERGHGLMVPNRFGRALQRAGASLTINLMGLDVAVDQILVKLPIEQATLLTFKALKNMTREALEPSIFSADSTYCSLIGRRDFLGNWSPASLAFISIRSVSEASSQLIIKVYALRVAGISGVRQNLRALIKDFKDAGMPIL